MICTSECLVFDTFTSAAMHNVGVECVPERKFSQIWRMFPHISPVFSINIFKIQNVKNKKRNEPQLATTSEACIKCVLWQSVPFIQASRMGGQASPHNSLKQPPVLGSCGAHEQSAGGAISYMALVATKNWHKCLPQLVITCHNGALRENKACGFKQRSEKCALSFHSMALVKVAVKYWLYGRPEPLLAGRISCSWYLDMASLGALINWRGQSGLALTAYPDVCAAPVATRC